MGARNREETCPERRRPRPLPTPHPQREGSTAGTQNGVGRAGGGCPESGLRRTDVGDAPRHRPAPPRTAPHRTAGAPLRAGLVLASAAPPREKGSGVTTSSPRASFLVDLPSAALTLSPGEREGASPAMAGPRRPERQAPRLCPPAAAAPTDAARSALNLNWFLHCSSFPVNSLCTFACPGPHPGLDALPTATHPSQRHLISPDPTQVLPPSETSPRSPCLPNELSFHPSTPHLPRWPTHGG